MEKSLLEFLVNGSNGMVRKSRIAKAIEIFRQALDEDSWTEQQLQVIIDFKNPYTVDLLKPHSLQLARAILGQDKIYSARKVHDVFGVPMHEPELVLYSKETLEGCAAENASGKADWRLVYLFPWNYANAKDRIRDFNFINWAGCSVNASQTKWGKRHPQAGYNLCNFMPSMVDMTYEEMRARVKMRQSAMNMARVVELLQILTVASKLGVRKDKSYSFHAEMNGLQRNNTFLVHLDCDTFDLEDFPSQSARPIIGVMMMRRQELTEAQAAARLAKFINS